MLHTFIYRISTIFYELLTSFEFEDWQPLQIQKMLQAGNNSKLPEDPLHLLQLLAKNTMMKMKRANKSSKQEMKATVTQK